MTEAELLEAENSRLRQRVADLEAQLKKASRGPVVRTPRPATEAMRNPVSRQERYALELAAAKALLAGPLSMSQLIAATKTTLSSEGLRTRLKNHPWFTLVGVNTKTRWTLTQTGRNECEAS